jgi:hypothetical protein
MISLKTQPPSIDPSQSLYIIINNESLQYSLFICKGFQHISFTPKETFLLISKDFYHLNLSHLYPIISIICYSLLPIDFKQFIIFSSTELFS